MKTKIPLLPGLKFINPQGQEFYITGTRSTPLYAYDTLKLPNGSLKEFERVELLKKAKDCTWYKK